MIEKLLGGKNYGFPGYMQLILFVVTNITFPFLFAPSFCTEGLPSLNIVQL